MQPGPWKQEPRTKMPRTLESWILVSAGPAALKPLKKLRLNATRPTKIQDSRVLGILVLGSWFHEPGCIKHYFFNAGCNAAGPAEPRSKNQEFRASLFLVLGSTGLVALNLNLSMLVLLHTGRWEPYNYYWLSSSIPNQGPDCCAWRIGCDKICLIPQAAADQKQVVLYS